MYTAVSCSGRDGGKIGCGCGGGGGGGGGDDGNGDGDDEQGINGVSSGSVECLP